MGRQHTVVKEMVVVLALLRLHCDLFQPLDLQAHTGQEQRCMGLHDFGHGTSFIACRCLLARALGCIYLQFICTHMCPSFGSLGCIYTQLMCAHMCPSSGARQASPLRRRDLRRTSVRAVRLQAVLHRPAPEFAPLAADAQAETDKQDTCLSQGSSFMSNSMPPLQGAGTEN